jgi:GAF domain-containing protein
MLIAPMLQRLRAARDLKETLAVAVTDVVALHGAERGNIQLFDGGGRLVIVAQVGLSAEFLRTFARVEVQDGTVCARCARQGETVFVPDVQQDAGFAPWADLARRVPFRSVLSSPIGSPPGSVGIVSVHFANRFSPSQLELRSLEGYCAQLAGVLLGHVGGPDALRCHAETLAAGLLLEVA